jgi:hypothetical protein
MTFDKFILDGEGNPVGEPDLLVWGKWLQTANRSLAKDQIGDVRISTVFLGLDHGYGGSPILWETMIFGGSHDSYCERYTSRAAALEGHAKAVTLVRGSR